ncbi:MAG: hypothetical protein GC182_13300 [Rhodopseudomonas sp.]|nr:hypothetical protein [Rhodopseudomonas sp.]
MALNRTGARRLLLETGPNRRSVLGGSRSSHLIRAAWPMALLGVIVAAFAPEPVRAQLVNPVTPYQSRLTIQNGGVNAALTVHRNPFGKPCLDIEAASRAHVINPDVYDNVVSIENRCSLTIRVKICYFNTDSCINVEVMGGQRKDAILGVRPHMQYFKYSFQEKF